MSKMRRAKNRKAQSSLEFVSITSFMFLVFVATFVTIEERMSGLYQDKLYQSMDELSKLVSAEVRMADFAPGNYEREFFLPGSISGFNYSIRITDKSELTIRAENLDFVIFLDQNVSGDIGKGKNMITKVDDEITVSNLCLEGAGGYDDKCGEIDCSGWYIRGTDADDTRNCYHKHSLYHLCQDQGECATPNSIACSFQTYNILDYTCSQCQTIIGCSGTDRGSCVNLPYGESCNEGGFGTCDGNGHCSLP